VSTATEILVRGPNWAGDLVMSTPGFRALRSGFPDARITLQLRSGLEALMAGAPWFDDLLPVDSYRQGARALLREGRALRRSRRFDLGLCIPDSFSSALLMRVAGVRRVVGYARGGRGPLLHQAVAQDPAWGKRRMVARERFVLGLTGALGCKDLGTGLELFTTDLEEAAADELVGARRGDRLRVAIAPGASFGPSKLWPARSFARAADQLAAEGAEILIVGAPSEQELADAVVAHMECPAQNLVGRLGLGSLKSVIRRCSLLVCNDAGARHVAVAFGVPSIVLFGPTSLEKTNLNLQQVTALETDVGCRPCYARECPIDHRCMTGLPVESVVAAARAALASPRELRA
jgi:heptosyltransferase-2